MNKQTEILYNYVHGRLTADQANDELAQERLNIRINPNRCKLTDEQIADGWGLLDTGTGSLDPVQMRDGELLEMDCGDMSALFFHEDKMYLVHGKKLEEVK